MTTFAPVPKDDLAQTTLAILCGSPSHDYGEDKGLFAPLGDENLVARAIRLWGEPFGEILVTVNDREQELLYQRTLGAVLSGNGNGPHGKIRIIRDIHRSDSRPSALTGVASALDLATKSRVVAVPIEQVGVRLLHLLRLGKEGDLHSCPVAFRGDDRSLLPFPSLWHKAHLPRMVSFVASLRASVPHTLGDLAVRTIEEPSWLDSLKSSIQTRDDAETYFGSPLVDPYGRRLHYLRFSLTEACNLSCHYCLPEGFPEWYRHKARLGMEAVGTLTRGFRLLGFRKLRLTGGEPTLHPHALDTVRLAQDLGYEEIAMTTNGLLIGDLGAWQSAGLTHLNVSLDSLDPGVYREMAGGRYESGADKVKATIEKALKIGLKVKVNTVLIRSKNGDEANIRTLIEWALGLPLTLRFIELMDTKLNASFASGERVFGHEIEPLLTEYGLSPRAKSSDPKKTFLGGPATEYVSPFHRGRIGLINPLSCNFCGDCNRLRVTARGGLKLCLFGNEDIPLDLSSPASIARDVRRAIGHKPEKHYLEDGLVGNVATFRTIGG